MIGADDGVAAGVVAWKRLNEHGRTCWDDWLTVARALLIGRTAALQAAETNRAVGSKYNAAMGRWLRDHGLADVVAQERYRLLLILENLPAIETWRADLDEGQHRRLNHPGAVWAHWRRSLKADQQSLHRHHVVSGSNAHGTGRPIYWPQDAIRRAATALRECRSNDTFTLARIALEAALRSESDLIDLLPSDAAAMSALTLRTDVVGGTGYVR